MIPQHHGRDGRPLYTPEPARKRDRVLEIVLGASALALVAMWWLA